ncbi:MAG TPA: pantoate--beta-alanine ligase, partial [Myxococcota bacterium]
MVVEKKSRSVSARSLSRSTPSTLPEKRAAAPSPMKKTAKKSAAKTSATTKTAKKKKKTAKTIAKKSTTKPTKTATTKQTPAAPRTTTTVHSPSALQARMVAARAAGLTIGFVPTMGALHDGHAALLDEARRRADIVVLSIFVNPTQFTQPEDLAKYPRTLEADVDIARRSGVDIVFAPAADDMYPPGFDTKLVAGQLAKELEGADRPGHFDGVLVVVNLLFSIVQPHFAVFGEKDYQQLQIVKRMTQDLRLPVEIVPMPVIRELDGLAMSSRNTRLSAADRERARALSKALVAGQDAVQRGEHEARAIAAAARAALVSFAP